MTGNSMLMKKLNLLLIFFILSFSGFLYFYKLAQIPCGFYVDEASVAYNAYSIVETGKDEYGFSYPVYFRLMGSYTPSLFIYLSTFLLKFFDMSVVLFRSISAVSALLSVYIFYLLISKLKLYKLNITYFVITFFYAVSPWMVFNARLGYETTLGFVVFNIGAYFLLLAMKKQKYLVSAVAVLSFSTYISHNQRVLAPLFLLGYLVLFRSTLLRKENLKVLKSAFLAGLIISVFNLSLIYTRAFWIKSAQFDINNIWNFLVYLSPKTLFFENPDIDLQHTIPKLSMLYNWMAIPYLVGLYLVIKRIKDIKYKFIVLYIVVTLLPSILSSHFVSSQKSLPFIIPLAIILGLGIDEILRHIKVAMRVVVLVFVAAYSILVLYTSYFILFPIERAHGWNYGYDQIAEYVRERPNDTFLLDDTRNPRAYILLLYHLSYPPEKYHKEVDAFYRNNYYKAPDPATSYRFSNVEVRSLDWEKDSKRDMIIIGDPLVISEQQMKEHNLAKIKEFDDPLGNVIFQAFKTQQ
jgi:hypothetical protein